MLSRDGGGGLDYDFKKISVSSWFCYYKFSVPSMTLGGGGGGLA